MQIQVAQRDIEEGQRVDPYDCAISKADCRSFCLEFGDIAVGSDRVVILSDDETCLQEYPLPEEARAFIARFDAGDLIAPFTFKI